VTYRKKQQSIWDDTKRIFNLLQDAMQAFLMFIAQHAIAQM
jgi:hypothetical protein